MGGSCASGMGVNVTAGSCEKACKSLPLVRMLDCTWEDVDAEILANCALLVACAEGSEQRIREALAAGAELETRTSKYVMLPAKSWREEQCANGDILPATSSTWNEPMVSERFGLTPLMVAAKEGHAGAVKLLLQVRAKPDTQDEDGMRPLHFAAEAGCQDCCRALLEAGAPPLVEDDGGRDAYACLPHERLSSQRERGSWVALLRPPVASCCGSAMAAAEPRKASAPLQPTSESEWDPFLGAPPGDGGM
mmetsp:Transcript_34204/g.79527  ORF Transcript_34204/g.79527 Transcript_34204/m.79527 type:complete len:250 (+) Transcript_34204:100-849(+)